MTDMHDTADSRLNRLMHARVRRAQVLTAAAAGLGLAALPELARAEGPVGSQTISFPFYPRVEGTYTPETIQPIVNNLLTFEYLIATLGVYQIQNAATLKIAGLELSVLQASVAVAQYHIDALSAVPGTAPITTTFTIPATAGQRSEDLNIALLAGFAVTMYLTAAREFAELGQPTLVAYAYEIGAAHAEVRGIGRALDAQAGDTSAVPPNNHAFEVERLLYTRQGIAVLTRAGVIGGSGAAVAYPGRDAVLAAAGPMLALVTATTPSMPPG